jgi:hypothetical protein
MAKLPNIIVLPASVDANVRRNFDELRVYFGALAVGGAATTVAGISSTPSTDPTVLTHQQLSGVYAADPTSSNVAHNKHVSNAQAKVWQEHVDIEGNPHATKHSEIVNVLGADPTSSDAAKVRHVSNAQAKRWEDGLAAQEMHGGLSVNANTSNLALAAQDTWYQYPYFDTNDPSNGMTPDHANDHITVGDTGTYYVSFAMSFSGSASTDFEAQVFINNGVTGFVNIHTERKLAASGDIGSAGGSGLVSLAAGDTVELWVSRTDGGGASKNFLGRDVTLSVIRVK